MCQIAETEGKLIYVHGKDIETSSSNANLLPYLIIVMLKDVISVILKMHIPFTPICNLHFYMDYALQFTVEYIMCVYIFEQRI